MKKYLFVFFAVCFVVFPGFAFSTSPVMEKYEDKIVINADGSANIESVIDLQNFGSDGILIPLNERSAKNISAGSAGTNPKKLTATEYTLNNEKFLKISGETPSGLEKIAISYEVDKYLDWKKAGPKQFDRYIWKSEFINTTPYIIRNYVMSIVLPPGYAIHSFKNSEPEFAEKDPAPPYSTTTTDNGPEKRILLGIAAKELKLGERCMLEYAFAPVKFSWFALLAAGLFAIVTLIAFRDIVAGGTRKS